MAEIASGICVATHYSPLVGFNLHVPPGLTADMLKNPDAVQAAAQLGRLDLMMAIMAAITLILTISAIVGYGFISSRAISIAKEETNRLLPNLIAANLKNNPNLISEAIKNDPALIKTISDSLKTLYGSLREDIPDGVISSFDKDIPDGVISSLDGGGGDGNSDR